MSEDEKQNEGEGSASSDLLDRLNVCLRNARYWMVERDALDQAEAAILEARGIALTLAEIDAGTNISLYGWRSNSEAQSSRSD